MNIIAYTALHYGTDYLASAIRSVIEHVDQYYVLYAAEGSHGHRTALSCPDSRDALYAIASAAAGDKLRWFDGSWPQEGMQRDTIHVVAPNADAVVVLDADEIWPTAFTRESILNMHDMGVRQWRMPIIHYWRSFRRAVLHDPAFPTRLIFPRVASGAGVATMPPINHMGYAQRSEIVDYKQLTHGHKAEWRHDIDWFKERFAANAQRDCHPVGSEYWNPELVDYRQYMPAWMSEHPYAQLEVIP